MRKAVEEEEEKENTNEAIEIDHLETIGIIEAEIEVIHIVSVDQEEAEDHPDAILVETATTIREGVEETEIRREEEVDLVHLESVTMMTGIIEITEITVTIEIILVEIIVIRG
jgi:hypothetical protein